MIASTRKAKVCTFKDAKEAEKAYRTGNAELHARVKVRITQTVNNEDGEAVDNRSIVDTTVGRAILSNRARRLTV